MKPTIKNTAPPVTAKALDETETQLGEKIPVAFREFLLLHNGGQPEPAFFKTAGDNKMESVGWFFAVDDTDAGLANMLDLYSADLPEELFPFASDPFGNLVCIATEGEHKGAIYFWLHEEGVKNISANDPACRIVASSFEEFMHSFAPFESK